MIRRRIAIGTVCAGALLASLASPAPGAAAPSTVAPVTWGDNTYGELGNGSMVQSAVASTVTGQGGVIAVASGEYHTLLVRADGTVWAWGNNDWGQLGNNTTCGTAPTPCAGSLTPVQVLGSGGVGFLSGITAVAAGFGHNLALRSDGTVWAWGDNSDGQLGDGGANVTRLTPVAVTGLTNVTSIAVGASWSLAVKGDGTAWAWGANDTGQLGQNTTGAGVQNSPIQVRGPGGVGFLTNVSSVGTGWYHSMAVKSDGTVWAWGDNRAGQLGQNTSCTPSPCGIPSPVQVMGPGGVGFLTNVQSVSKRGFLFSLALKSDGTVWDWGSNDHGQLGNNTTSGGGCACISVPVQASGLTGATAVAAGNSHALALRSDGTVWAWGWNTYGQLGIGTTADAQIPTQALNIDYGVALAGGRNSTIAIGRVSTVHLTAGSLNLSPVGAVTFTPVVLNGGNQTTTATVQLGVIDATGSGTGWNITATSTTFTAGGNTLPTNATSVVANPTRACDAGSTCNLATTGVACPCALPAATVAPAAVKLFNATAGTGRGAELVSATFTLAAPANSYSGSYVSTWTISLVSGP